MRLKQRSCLPAASWHETDHLDGRLYVDIMSRELFDEDDPQDEETEDSKA